MFAGAARCAFRSSASSFSRISCSAAGARTSFSKPAASTAAFSRHASTANFRNVSHGVAAFLNKDRSKFSIHSTASATAPSSILGRATSSPSTATSSTSSVSTTSTATATTSSSSGSSSLIGVSEDSDGNSNASERIHGRLEDPWPDIVVRPRIEEYYRNNVLEDLMVLMYDHYSPDADIQRLDEMFKDEWKPEFHIKDLFSVPVEALPAYDPIETVTSLLTHKATKHTPPKQERLPMKRNLIDYNSTRKDDMYRFLNPKRAPPPPYAPLPSRLPCLKRITLKIWHEDAANNKAYLLPAIMSLQSITGIRADPIFAERGDSTKKIREGMPLGAKVELTHSRMYSFLDKLTQCVLPRLAEWDGFNPAGNGMGTIEFVIPSIAVGQFPDIESYFEMFPRLFDVTVVVETTGRNDLEAVMLLSALQVPFMEEKYVEKVEAEEGEVDPWAKFKKKKFSKDDKKGGRKK